MLGEFSEGLVYVRKTPVIGQIILMVAIASLLVMPYNTVFPVFAKVIFKGGASHLGISPVLSAWVRCWARSSWRRESRMHS